MGGMDLHRVESCLFRQACGPGKGRYDAGNIPLTQHTASGLAVLLHCGGPDGLQAAQRSVSRTTPVNQLQSDLPSHRMHALDHIPKLGQKAVIVSSQLSGTGLARGTDEGVTANDQANFSSGQLHHHFCESGGNGAMLVCQPLPRGRPDEPVGQAHAVDKSSFK